MLVEWSNREQQIEFIQTAPVIWDGMALDLSEIEDVSSFIEAMKEAVRQKAYKQEALIHLTVKVPAEYDEDFIHFIQKKEFEEQLTRQLNVDNVWVTSVELDFLEATNQQSLQKLYPNEWAAVLEKTKTIAEFNEMTENILEQIPSRYLNEMNTKEYRMEMIQKAIAKLHLK